MDDLDLYEEGMDWDKFAENGLKTTPGKVARVLGDEYGEAIRLGQFPWVFFVEEHLSEYMHRVAILGNWELKQEALVAIGSNPEGEFELSSAQEIPPIVTLHYCTHRTTGQHLNWSAWNELPEDEKEEYLEQEEAFSSREIRTLMRFAARWDNYPLEQQEATMKRLREQQGDNDE